MERAFKLIELYKKKQELIGKLIEEQESLIDTHKSINDTREGGDLIKGLELELEILGAFGECVEERLEVMSELFGVDKRQDLN